MFTTAIQFIDENGGSTVVARATGKSRGAVEQWRHKNKLPRANWPEILEAFPSLTMEDLKLIEANAGRAPAAAEEAA